MAVIDVEATFTFSCRTERPCSVLSIVIGWEPVASEEVEERTRYQFACRRKKDIVSPRIISLGS